MRSVICAAIFILSLLTSGTCYAWPWSEKKQPPLDTPQADPLLAEQTSHEEGYNNFQAERKLVLDKIAKRTGSCKDELDNMFLMVNNLTRTAHKDKNAKREKELVIVMSDYNSVIGDLGLMQVLLDMGQFVAEEKKFIEYYGLVEDGFERLKGSYSFKNEIFLGRLDTFKDEEALRYEKKLYGMYRDYFEYDPKIDKVDIPENKEQDKGKTKDEGNNKAKEQRKG
ncbi:MAG: hypothetical protein PHV40_02730 [Candidatus Omnitrophica bacterium]|nr:hypothetical protein [Candidatus Omnitrophota bacterium]MDD5501464.1 hypothetical protein [Candidatus Omnitrophota bacterium]